jgi:hypothetical protein
MDNKATNVCAGLTSRFHLLLPWIFSECELVDFLKYLGASSCYILYKLHVYCVHFFYLSEQIDKLGVSKN